MLKRLSSNQHITSYLFSISIVIFLFRTVSPSFKYLFAITFLMVVFLNRSKSLIRFRSVKKFLKQFTFAFILFFYPFIAFLQTKKIMEVVLYDSINTAILFLFFYLLQLVKTNPNIFLRNFLQSLLYISILASVIVLISNFAFLINKSYLILNYSNINKWDYNYISLLILFGLIILLNNNYLILRKPWIKACIFLLYYSALFLLGSRRGFFCLLFILCFYFVYQLIFNPGKTKRSNSILTAGISFGLFGIFLYAFFFIVTPKTKINLLQTINTENIMEAKSFLTLKFNRTVGKVFGNSNVDSLHKKIWNLRNFDPKDPASGWGYQRHSIWFPIDGIGSESVPFGCKAYRMDKFTNYEIYGKNVATYSFIKSVSPNGSDSIRFSSYCYVSDNFNGDFVRISTHEAGVALSHSYYDLNNKGCWQLIELRTNNTGKNDVHCYLNWGIKNRINYDSLTGYVAFAYPIVNSTNLNSKENLVLSEFTNKKHCANSVPLSLDKIHSTLKTKNALELLNYGIITYFKKVASKFHHLINLFYSSNKKAPSPPEQLALDVQPNNNMLSSRFNRWVYALEIYHIEYTWGEKIWGGGFDYLNWYGNYFYKDNTREDWPHNPFLSILLYSGIIGLLMYMFFLYRVFTLYWKYRKEYGIFFIFFLITFFFGFFSSNGPFDPPVCGFFVLLPFFIHYIHKKDTKQGTLEKSKQTINLNDENPNYWGK